MMYHRVLLKLGIIAELSFYWCYCHANAPSDCTISTSTEGIERKKMTNLKLSSLLIGIFSLTFSVYPCKVSITNDGPAKILIIDNNDNKAFEVQKGKTKIIGDPHKLANCDIYTKKLGARSYNRQFTCEQNEYAKDGKLTFTLSDLERKTDATRLFTITDHQQQPTVHSAFAHNAQTEGEYHNHGCVSCGKK